MFSILYFAVLVIGAIGANDFEIRHSIELGNEDAAEINQIDVQKDQFQLISSEAKFLSVFPGQTRIKRPETRSKKDHIIFAYWRISNCSHF